MTALCYGFVALRRNRRGFHKQSTAAAITTNAPAAGSGTLEAVAANDEAKETSREEFEARTGTVPPKLVSPTSTTPKVVR